MIVLQACDCCRCVIRGSNAPLVAVGGLAMQAGRRWRTFDTPVSMVLLQYDHAVRLGLSDFEHLIDAITSCKIGQFLSWNCADSWSWLEIRAGCAMVVVGICRSESLGDR